MRTKENHFETNGDRWTESRLRLDIQNKFGASRVCVIANREPYIHERRGSNIEIQAPASGLVTALEPIVRACSGLWIAHGSGSADRETADRNGVLLVPPGSSEYALKRVWLTREEEKGYYYGFANEGLWPLCHIVHTRPIFRLEDWKYYAGVNTKFADVCVSELKEDCPVILVQDYHFALLPKMLRERNFDADISLFWHIPWSSPDVMRICPWKSELIEGMLGADLIGFQTQYHCNNFLDSVDRFLEARVDREHFSVTIQGHTCFVRPFPISIAVPPKHDASAEDIPNVRFKLLKELHLPQDSQIGLGVDRIDYTKGIVERFLAVERLLEKYPQWIGNFVFIQIGAPSRTHIKRYQELGREILELANHINLKFHRPHYEPILLRLQHHDSKEIYRFYRAADVCVVNSLHDGMNLVAKEFVASRSDGGGALILSSFTGAARDLLDAYIINPYDIEATAEAIHEALIAPVSVRRQKMERMGAQVSSHNVYEWAGKFLAQIHHISGVKNRKHSLSQYETA